MPEIRDHDHDKQLLALGEERLRLIIDAAPNGMLIVNQKGEIVLVNSQIERMFQYSRAELLGQSVEMLVPEAARERHAAYRDKSFHETPTRAMGVGRDLHGLRKDGSQILVEIGLSPLSTEGETFVLAAVVDITERKRSEELLQDQMLAVRKSATRATEAEAFLKLALAASQTGVFSHDLATDKVASDDQLRAIFGGTLGDDFAYFLGRVNVDDRGAVKRSIEAAIKEKSGFELDYRITWPDSSIHHIFARGNVYCHETGNPARITGVCVDITKRRLAAQEHLQLAAIVESSDDGIISKTLDGTILSWNQAAERIYGYCAKEMIGENIAKLIPENLPDELPAIIGRLKRGERIEQQEAVRQRKDGAIIDVSLTISPVKDESAVVSGASTIVRDISIRKRTERLLSTQYAVTRILSESDSLTDAAPAILQLIAQTLAWDIGEIWSVDKDQQVLRCVDVWRKEELGIEAFEALARHITLPCGTGLPGLVWSKGEPIWINDVGMHRNFPRVHLAQKIGLHTGVGFPILRGNHVLGTILLFSREIREFDKEMHGMLSSIGEQIGQFMERKLSDQMALQATKAEQSIGRAILENAPIGIARLNKNLVITEANDVFSKQFGIALDELLGKFIFALPLDLPNEQLLTVVQQGIPFSRDNFRVVVDGSDRLSECFFDLAIWPVKGEDGLSNSVILLTMDVTERVKLTKQREDFVATLSHDLKNPLIGQDRMLGLLLEGRLGPLQEEQAKILSLFKAGTDEMLELIGILLDVYRYEGGAQQLRIEQLDAKQLISGSIDQLDPIAKAKGITIRSTFPEALPAMPGDQLALKRVVMNLLDNAIKFTPAGGLIQFSCQYTGSSFIITVEDNGSGISAHELQSLFQRFTQAGSGKRHKAGTGLGLYLCRQIVEAHSGKITCASQEGIGTTFEVTLPN